MHLLSGDGNQFVFCRSIKMSDLNMCCVGYFDAFHFTVCCRCCFVVMVECLHALGPLLFRLFALQRNKHRRIYGAWHIHPNTKSEYMAVISTHKLKPSIYFSEGIVREKSITPAFDKCISLGTFHIAQELWIAISILNRCDDNDILIAKLIWQVHVWVCAFIFELTIALSFFALWNSFMLLLIILYDYCIESQVQRSL